jgi:hypothetical protein
MSPSLHQYRLAPVPVPIAVAVDGSDPEALGVVWLPRTAVGEGDEPAGDGRADAPGLFGDSGDIDGDPDAAAGGGVAGAADGVVGVVANGDVLGAIVADAFGEELGLA